MTTNKKAVGKEALLSESGKHWAIMCSPSEQIDYIQGSEAETPDQAERKWREYTRLWFLTVEVRRTTPSEDKRLAHDHIPDVKKKVSQ